MPAVGDPERLAVDEGPVIRGSGGPLRSSADIAADPESGAVLDVGRTSYRPPAALADVVRGRDVECHPLPRPR